MQDNQYDIPVSWSEVTAAVKPTPDEPRPVVEIASGAMFMIALNSWDLATEGSPTIIMFISLRLRKKSTTTGHSRKQADIHKPIV